MIWSDTIYSSFRRRRHLKPCFQGEKICWLFSLEVGRKKRIEGITGLTLPFMKGSATAKRVKTPRSVRKVQGESLEISSPFSAAKPVEILAQRLALNRGDFWTEDWNDRSVGRSVDPSLCECLSECVWLTHSLTRNSRPEKKDQLRWSRNGKRCNYLLFHAATQLNGGHRATT